MGKFELTPEEYKVSENQAIVSSFMDVAPSQKPKALFVLAQPGAGKTGLTSFVKREFDNRVGESLLHIDPDRIAVFHKYYKEIMDGNLEESYKELQKFAAPALKVINEMAVERGVNILTEGTFRDKASYLTIIENLANHQYEMEFNLMAVSPLESMLSAMERYYQMVRSGLPPRNVEKIHHDRAYSGMLDTLRTVEESGKFSKIRIFTRGNIEREPNLIFSKTTEERQSSATDALVKAREAETQKIIQRPNAFRNRMKEVRLQIAQYGNDDEKQLQQLSEIEQQLEGLLQEVRE